MPLYYLPQNSAINSANARDSSNMNVSITDIPITNSYIIYGTIFAIISSLLTYFISGIIFFLVFQSINSIEHEKLNDRIKYLMNVVYKSKEKSSWKEKIQRAIWKIRGLTAWRLLLNDIKNGNTTIKKHEKDVEIDNFINNSEESNQSQFKVDAIVEHKNILPNYNEIDVTARSNNSKIGLFNNSSLFERNKLIGNNSNDNVEQIALTFEFNANIIETVDNFEYKGPNLTGSKRSNIKF